MRIELKTIQRISLGLILSFLFLTSVQAESDSPNQHITIQTERTAWKGDLDGMIKRRIVRVLVPYNKTLYFLDKGGQQRGFMYDMMTAFEQDLNKKTVAKHLKIQFLFIPTRRDQLIPDLLAGKGDIIAANLTVTPERQKLIDFSSPIANGVKEVVVTATKDPNLHTLEDLSGKAIFVNPTTSYMQHLKTLNTKLAKEKKLLIKIKEAPGEFETEDALEMVNAGLVPATVSDLYLANFWKNIFPNIQIHENLVLHDDGEIAFAFRKKSRELKKTLDEFSKKNKIG